MNTTETVSMVQISLFDQGRGVKEAIAKAVVVKESIKKDKNKVVVRNTRGEPVITSRLVTLPPRKSKSVEDLSDISGLTGQALMMFEQEARQQLMESGFSHLAKLVASGNYTFDRARTSSNGKFAFAIKPAIGKAAILSESDLIKQAEALGFKLVPTGEAPAATEPAAVETELVVAKTPAKAAAKPAPKKKTVGIKATVVATAPTAS